ncbi:uncharacterized protein E5676_scaffold968G00030 [Cucumis melo var. makuwa]|nr:uncharacterized protein E5676_scaffold968G00030 [Cucumis melo var. makuwa]
MSEKDKVFCFVEGLKPWAKTKLYEQRVQDLMSAYSAIVRLFDLTSDSQDVRSHQSSSPGRNRNSRSSSPKDAEGGKDSSRDRRPYQSSTENTWRRPNNRCPPKRPLSCFICGRPHLARECPNKVDFHAFQASLIADSDDKSNRAEGEVGQIDGSEKTRIGAIKYMSSLQEKSGERNVPVEKGLLYVDTWINQKQTKSTMIDSGATHNFITEAEARRMRLRWEKDSERMKVVNSVALPIVGLVKRTMIKLGGWKGPIDFVVVKMDDFDVVLEMEFLLEHQVIPMSSARCLVITGSFPTVVQADIRQPNRFKMISAMQLDKNLTQEEPPSVRPRLGRWEKGRRQSPRTLCVPEKCHGVMPNSWPKSLSMRRRIDHGIELPLEAKAHAKDAYRTTPPKLVVLRKQSKKLSSTGVSRPIQASWGAPVHSLKKKDRNPQQRIDRRIQNKLTIRRTYPFPLLPNLFDRSRGVKCFPKSDIQPRYCRVRVTEVKGLETTCVTGLRAYEFPVVPFSLTNAKEGKCCSVQGQINVLGHVVELHKVEVGKRKIATTCEGRILKSVAALRSCSKPINSNGRSMKGFLTRASSQTEWMTKLPIQGATTTPTREMHKFLVKWKKPLVEVTNGEHVEDLGAWTQKIEELQLRQLTRKSTV